MTAGVVAAGPYLSKLEAFAAPPRRRQPGHSHHDLPERRQRRAQHGRPGRRSRLREPAADDRHHERALGRQRARAAPVAHEAQGALRRRARSRSSAASATSRPTSATSRRPTSGCTVGAARRCADHRLARPLSSTICPNTDHESLYGVGLHGGVNAHLAGAISQASSLPRNIGDAFGVDRSDPSDARMYDDAHPHGRRTRRVSARSAISTTRPRWSWCNSRSGSVPRTASPRSRPTSRQQLVLAAHLINANLGIRVIDTGLDGFDTHSDQADLARDAHVTPRLRRSTRSSPRWIRAGARR